MRDNKTAIGLLGHDLQYRRNKIQEELQKHGPLIQNNLSYFEHRDTVVAYFAVAYELIGLYQELIFQLEFIEEEYRGDISEHMGRKTITQILNEHEILGDRLQNDCRDVVEFRRKLVHDTPDAILKTSLQDVSDQLRVSERAVMGLQDLIKEMQDDSNPIV